VEYRKTRARGEPYPQFFSLADILTAWNPDRVDIPASYPLYNSLRSFDHSDTMQRLEAEQYRQAEVPFVIRNIPSLGAATAKWTPDYLNRSFGAARLPAEVSASNHFMYYRGTSGGFVAPTNATNMTFAQWWQAADAKDADPGSHPFVYVALTSNADKHKHAVRQAVAVVCRCFAWRMFDAPFCPVCLFQFIAEDLPMFKVEKSLFVVDPTQFQGIHCRIGMPGIIAESHYDGGRNFIAVIRGARRYILSPPSECDKLHLIRSGPSSRHSSLNWSSPDDIAKLHSAAAVEVVLMPGDVLYVPSLWFHFTVNLERSYQCNARSGTPDVDLDPIRKCGFFPFPTERGTSEPVLENRAKLPKVRWV
jgi:hypothetical protein